MSHPARVRARSRESWLRSQRNWHRRQRKLAVVTGVGLDGFDRYCWHDDQANWYDREIVRLTDWGGQ